MRQTKRLCPVSRGPLSPPKECVKSSGYLSPGSSGAVLPVRSLSTQVKSPSSSWANMKKDGTYGVSPFNFSKWEQHFNNNKPMNFPDLYSKDVLVLPYVRPPEVFDPQEALDSSQEERLMHLSGDATGPFEDFAKTCNMKPQSKYGRNI